MFIRRSRRHHHGITLLFLAQYIDLDKRYIDFDSRYFRFEINRLQAHACDACVYRHV